MILITVCRTLFYQFFLLFIGISIGFICNAEWVGWKTEVVAKSVDNIFFPTKFDEKTCEQIKNWGKFRIFAFNNRPQDFKIIEDGLLAEEFYIAKFTYTDQNGNTAEKIDTTRVRWKTWEYYYTDPSPWKEEDLKDYIDNGTLNSHESDKALRLYQELKRRNLKEREKDEKKNGSAGPRVYTGFIL